MSRKYMDVSLSPEERATILLAEMSLDEKMAQVNTICMWGNDITNMELIS